MNQSQSVIKSPVRFQVLNHVVCVVYTWKLPPPAYHKLTAFSSSSFATRLQDHPTIWNIFRLQKKNSLQHLLCFSWQIWIFMKFPELWTTTKKKWMLFHIFPHFFPVFFFAHILLSWKSHSTVDMHNWIPCNWIASAQ